MRTKGLILSKLGHTWIFDIDGTLVKHNGYKIEGCDTLLTGVKEFLNSIPEKDMIIFLTSRKEEYKEQTINFFQSSGIRYDHIIFNAPCGERILINDCKPSGLEMSVAVNVVRDADWVIDVKEDPTK